MALVPSILEIIKEFILKTFPDDAALLTIADADVAMSASYAVTPSMVDTLTMFGLAIRQFFSCIKLFILINQKSLPLQLPFLW